MGNNSRRHGEIVAYWGTTSATGAPVAQTTQSGAFSKAIYIGQNVDQFAFQVSVSGPTVISLYAAHSSELTLEGNDPDRSTAPSLALFYPVYVAGGGGVNQVKITFAAAGTAYLIVPDFVPGWTILQTSGNPSIYAGYEAVAL